MLYGKFEGYTHAGGKCACVHEDSIKGKIPAHRPTAQTAMEIEPTRLDNHISSCGGQVHNFSRRPNDAQCQSSAIRVETKVPAAQANVSIIDDKYPARISVPECCGAKSFCSNRKDPHCNQKNAVSLSLALSFSTRTEEKGGLPPSRPCRSWQVSMPLLLSCTLAC